MNIEKRYIYDYLKCLYYSRSSTVSNVKYVGVFHYIFVLFNIPLTCFMTRLHSAESFGVCPVCKV